MGGYGNQLKILQKSNLTTLAILVFRSKSTKMNRIQDSLRISAKYDDLAGASVRIGSVRVDTPKRPRVQADNRSQG
jgi:hypothetical protein